MAPLAMAPTTKQMGSSFSGTKSEAFEAPSALNDKQTYKEKDIIAIFSSSNRFILFDEFFSYSILLHVIYVAYLFTANR